MPPKTPIRVRIAPSPTGYFHIGTARSALFNWLFAKKEGGVFIVRIEDTDTARSEKKYEQDILEQLHWLGLDWDEGPIVADSRGNVESQINTENNNLFLRASASNQRKSAYRGNYGPYRQSERGEIYEKYIKRLLEEKHAYYCFCAKDELEAMRNEMMTEGLAPKYNGHCRALSETEVKKNLASGKESVIRFKINEIKISFHDLIRDKVEFDMSLMGDIVIAKNLTSPLYNFAAVIDDFEMKISHVIRAEDHLANTPKQIAIQTALGFPAIHFAHMPLILNPDKSKMSKRFSATALSEYRAAGYLPEAMVNFLALLGWHPVGDAQAGVKEKEIFAREELIRLFDLKRVQKGGAVFNEEKLNWLNGQFIKKLSAQELLDRIKSVNLLPNKLPELQLIKIIATVRDRIKKLSDFNQLASFFFVMPDYPDQLLIWKNAEPGKMLASLKKTQDVLKNIEDQNFNKEALMVSLNPLAESLGRGEVFWPLRAALSGQEASPGPFEIMDALGKEESLLRIHAAIQKLSK